MDRPQDGLWPEGLDSLEVWSARRDLDGLPVYGVTAARLGTIARCERTHGRLAACEVALDEEAREANRWSAEAVRLPADAMATLRDDGLHLALDVGDLLGHAKQRERRRDAADTALR